jgi:DNA-binding response OmpR family regulator
LNRTLGPLPQPDVDILFVGGDPNLAATYKLKLELDGFSVQVAPPSSDAVHEARHHHPDLIFLDVGRRATECQQIVEALRADTAAGRIPLVILSGFGQDEMADSGLTLGDSDYLVNVEPPL